SPASLLLEPAQSGEQLFPAGTGFAFQPGEVVIFQAHTLNTTPADIHPTLDVKLELGDPATVPDRLGLLQFYDPSIVVPAHTQAKAQMRCSIPQDMSVVLGTTHQHVRGTGVQVFVDAPDGTPGQTPIVSSTDWQHPAVSGDVVKLAAGSHVRTVCDY